jgi:HD-GYP domain-containing protein (c-di-GMP phosphodiesterase class II)
MPTVPLSQVKLGDRFASDVITPLGGTLFRKGRVVTSREYEILQAFLVKQVDIEPREGAEEIAATEEAALTRFDAEYDRLISLVRRIFVSNTSGIGLPIMDIRKQLENVLAHIGEYNALTFMPRIADKQDYLYHKSVLTALTSHLLAQWCAFPKKDWLPLALAGLFHDIGMLRIDPAILYKPSALTAAEKEEVQNHTKHGYNLLKNVAALNEGVKLTALQHHEKMDGSGYPLGLKGDKIHPYARLVAVADVFHSITLERSYSRPISPYLALEQLQNESFGKLDPVYVRTLIEKLTSFHNGMVVRLSDNRLGEIVFTDRNNPTRPLVSVGGQIINLVTERGIHIESVIR